MDFFGPFGLSMFTIMPMIIFAVVISMFIFVIVKGISTWSYNNSQPVLDVYATIVAKRQNVSSSMNHTGAGATHHHHHTSYFVTFQVESGDRMELRVDGREYGMLAEGDSGMLRFQGTRYLGFTRDMEQPV